MRSYNIIDQDLNLNIGCLICYEKSEDCVVELIDGIDEWSAPLLFDKFVKDKIYTIPRKASKMWVEERVIPSDRQNLAVILKNHKLKEYNIFKLLDISKGKCAQDNMYIEAINKLPEYVGRRNEEYIRECVTLSNGRLLCFFNDGMSRIIHLEELMDIDKIEYVLRDEKLYRSMRIVTGGRCISFNNSIDIPSYRLRLSGEQIQLSLDDFITFARLNLLDTTDSCNMLECTRQNLAYLARTDKLLPIMENVRGSLYLRSDLENVISD